MPLFSTLIVSEGELLSLGGYKMEKAPQRKNENSFTVMHAAFLELLSIIVDDKRFQCAIESNAISGHRSAISTEHTLPQGVQ
jgi:hypothetical protein